MGSFPAFFALCGSQRLRRRRRPVTSRVVLALIGVFVERSLDVVADISESLYCGREYECYEVLELKRVDNPSAQDVKKAMRRLSLRWHPDKGRVSARVPRGGRDAAESVGASSSEISESEEQSEEETEESVRLANFHRVQRAHDTLIDPVIRAAYDLFLDDPEGSEFANYYRFYRASYTGDLDTPLWAVFVGLLCFLSLLQYVNASWRYNSTRALVLRQDKFRDRVDALLRTECQGWQRTAVEDRVFELEVVIDGAKPPRVFELVLFSLFLRDLPRVLFAVAEWVGFVWKFGVLGRELGAVERDMLTWKALGFPNAETWREAVEEETRRNLIARELWMPANLRAFEAEHYEAAKEKVRDSAKYKRAKRFMKKNR